MNFRSDKILSGPIFRGKNKINSMDLTFGLSILKYKCKREVMAVDDTGALHHGEEAWKNKEFKVIHWGKSKFKYIP